MFIIEYTGLRFQLQDSRKEEKYGETAETEMHLFYTADYRIFPAGMRGFRQRESYI